IYGALIAGEPHTGAFLAGRSGPVEGAGGAEAPLPGLGLVSRAALLLGGKPTVVVRADDYRLATLQTVGGNGPAWVLRQVWLGQEEQQLGSSAALVEYRSELALLYSSRIGSEWKLRCARGPLVNGWAPWAVQVVSHGAGFYDANTIAVVADRLVVATANGWSPAGDRSSELRIGPVARWPADPSDWELAEAPGSILAPFAVRGDTLYLPCTAVGNYRPTLVVHRYRFRPGVQGPETGMAPLLPEANEAAVLPYRDRVGAASIDGDGTLRWSLSDSW
ncbi:MAG TPA: hypothetical protein VEI97_05555, partial [bacterium]|nr:hypothetical protein [bacterium]